MVGNRRQEAQFLGPSVPDQAAPGLVVNLENVLEVEPIDSGNSTKFAHA